MGDFERVVEGYEILIVIEPFLEHQNKNATLKHFKLLNDNATLIV